jgi:hypothetical protein
MSFIAALANGGEILAQDDVISMGRYEEAVVRLDRAFQIGDDFVHQDANGDVIH